MDEAPDVDVRRRGQPSEFWEVQMFHFIDVQLQCQSCTESIRFSVIDVHVNRESHGRMRIVVNELLIDYGWLPTRSGPLCRRHAAALRAAA